MSKYLIKYLVVSASITLLLLVLHHYVLDLDFSLSSYLLGLAVGIINVYLGRRYARKQMEEEFDK